MEVVWWGKRIMFSLAPGSFLDPKLVVPYVEGDLFARGADQQTSRG